MLDGSLGDGRTVCGRLGEMERCRVVVVKRLGCEVMSGDCCKWIVISVCVGSDYVVYRGRLSENFGCWTPRLP